MERRKFDAVNPWNKLSEISKKRTKLQELRAIHYFSNQWETAARQTSGTPETAAEQTSGAPETPPRYKHLSKTEKFEEEVKNFFLTQYKVREKNQRQKHKQEITDKFIDHCQPAKKVYDRLTPFLDDYQRCQEDLKKPDLPMGQLQAMHFYIQRFLGSLTSSDQQFPETAKEDIKAFLDTHLVEMNAATEEMDRLKPFGPYSETISKCMGDLQEKLAKFAEKLEQSGITNLDQLKSNLTDSLTEIAIREREQKKKIESIIKTIGRKLDEVSKNWQFAFNEDVSRWQEDLKAARLYTNQESGVTTEGLTEKCQILRTDNEHLDELIETRIREEVDNWSKYVMDVPYIQPKGGMFRNFEIANVLDKRAFERLAGNFHEALKPEKQPEDLYRVLHSLQREPEAINGLDNAYRQNYGKTLETALNERFGKPEDSAQLEYALQLINRGNPKAEWAIKSNPPTEVHEFYSVAMRIHQYLNQPKLKPETTYAYLTPFARNTGSLYTLDRRYTHLYRTSLRSDIENTLQGDPKAKAKDYALFLIGDQTLEKKVTSWSEAARLQKALLKQTFARDDGIHIPVPYDRLSQSGTNWTHIMREALKEAGYESKKIIALSLRVDENGQKLPNLHVHTDLAPDVPDGKDPIITSMYRMAPLIQVEASFGMVELVLDPSLSSEPLTIKQWLGKMRQDSFEPISLGTYQTKLDDDYQKNRTNLPHPAGQTYVITGSRNLYALPFSRDHINRLLTDKQGVKETGNLAHLN